MLLNCLRVWRLQLVIEVKMPQTKNTYNLRVFEWSRGRCIFLSQTSPDVVPQVCLDNKQARPTSPLIFDICSHCKGRYTRGFSHSLWWISTEASEYLQAILAFINYSMRAKFAYDYVEKRVYTYKLRDIAKTSSFQILLTELP